MTANLFEQPTSWQGGFDLVNECYTLQALPPQMLEKTTAAIAGLVADGGNLLVYTRLRKDDAVPDGPPWPLRHGDALGFSEYGFDLVNEELFENKRGDRVIPTSICALGQNNVKWHILSTLLGTNKLRLVGILLILAGLFFAIAKTVVSIQFHRRRNCKFCIL